MIDFWEDFVPQAEKLHVFEADGTVRPRRLSEGGVGEFLHRGWYDSRIGDALHITLTNGSSGSAAGSSGGEEENDSDPEEAFGIHTRRRTQ